MLFLIPDYDSMLEVEKICKERHVLQKHACMELFI